MSFKLCRHAVTLGREYLGFDWMEMWFVGETPDVLTGTFTANARGEVFDRRTEQMPLEPNSLIRQMILEDKPQTLTQELSPELPDGSEAMISRAIAANCGATALDLADKHRGRIHLLLTDVVMPGMSGRHLAGQLVAKRPETKIIYMSGYTDDAIVHHGALNSGTAFLQKPVSPIVLARKLREVLDAPRKR